MAEFKCADMEKFGGCSCYAAAAKFGGKGFESRIGGEVAPRCAAKSVRSCLDLELLATNTIEKCGRRWFSVEEVTMLLSESRSVMCYFYCTTAAAIRSLHVPYNRDQRL